MTESAQGAHRVPWLRIGAEAVAIIASILIAFALDAWWDGRELAEREARYLSSLQQEFGENRDDLVQAGRTQGTVLESIRALILLGATGAPRPDADSVAGLLNTIFRDINVRLRPNLTTYEDLLNTSSLLVLRNDSLRTLLAKFDVGAEAVSTVENVAVEAWSRDAAEQLRTRLDLAPYLPPHLLGSDTSVAFPSSSVDLRSLPTDRVFRNIMVGQLASTAVRLSMYRDLESIVDHILGVLGQELRH